MIANLRTRIAAACLIVIASWNTADASILISEWMYNGAGATGEYIELTNFGVASVDFTGWSFDDDSRNPGTVDISSIGIVAPGESVIITEATAAAFRTTWGLPLSAKVFGSNSTNLGRNDEINIYDALDNLVDRLTYGDENIPGTIRAQNLSGNPLTPAALGANDVSQWVLATVGDSYGSYLATTGDVGNPGVHVVPEPTSLILAAIGLVGISLVRRRR